MIGHNAPVVTWQDYRARGNALVARLRRLQRNSHRLDDSAFYGIHARIDSAIQRWQRGGWDDAETIG